MFKTFIAEINNVLKSKWKIIAVLIIMFIPFFYAFFYSNAYWKPFESTNELKIGVVDLDGTTTSKQLKNGILKDKGGLYSGENKLKVNIKDATSIYESADEANKAVDNGDYDALIVVKKGYESGQVELSNKLTMLIKTFLIPKLNKNEAIDFAQFSTILKPFFGEIDQWKKANAGMVTFYNSYKHNYLTGEITSIIQGLNKPIAGAMLLKVKTDLAPIIKSITNQSVMMEFGKLVNSLSHELHIVNTTYSSGEPINSYGKGLAPYFMSIALWAGSLVMLFVFHNTRKIKGISTIKNYFGKSMIWIIVAWIQSLILSTAMWLQGFEAWSGIYQLYAYNLFLATVFALTVQGIGFSIRRADIGEIIAVVLLVIQLVSSSGTFPVSTENIIFRILNPVVPFTYSINIFREIMWRPDLSSILFNGAILLIYPLISITIALSRNLIFDKKNLNLIEETWSYKKFKIDMGDL